MKNNQAKNLKRLFSTDKKHKGANGIDKAELLSDVLLVQKTPRYERLKDGEIINHPYVQDVLIHNWIEANNLHFELAEKFEKVLREQVGKLTISQEWPLTSKDTKGKSLVISLGGDGTYLRTASMILNDKVPLLGINSDPKRSSGVLCGKNMFKNRSSEKHIKRIFD